MTLRHKFGLLALLYAITLAANVALCSWSLLLYYQTFMAHVEPTNVQVSHESLAARILAINAACGVGVGLLGLRLVRRWVMTPVAGLRAAALELGKGNLSCRAPVISRDELGQLAVEINSMASSIVHMQSRIVEQERRAVAAQALRCVIHNIRSPLTGVRWLAEAITMRDDVDPQTAQGQARIMQAVDEVLSWLQEFRESLQEVCTTEAAAVGQAADRVGTDEA